MAIFCMVLASIYSTWTAILQASKTAQDATAAVQRTRVTAHVIEQSLGGAACYVANQPLYSFVFENGGEGFLEFTSRLPRDFPRSGRYGDFEVRRIRFSLRASADGRAELALNQWPLLMEMDEDEKNFPLVLAKNVTEFKTEAWDLKEQAWVDEWKKTNEIPDADQGDAPGGGQQHFLQGAAGGAAASSVAFGGGSAAVADAGRGARGARGAGSAPRSAGRAPPGMGTPPPNPTMQNPVGQFSRAWWLQDHEPVFPHN